MNDSDSPSNPASPRVTLKLKGPARKPTTERIERTEPTVAEPRSKPGVKPGAHWSDEYRRRMQADMDDLISK